MESSLVRDSCSPAVGVVSSARRCVAIVGRSRRGRESARSRTSTNERSGNLAREGRWLEIGLRVACSSATPPAEQVVDAAVILDPEEVQPTRVPSKQCGKMWRHGATYQRPAQQPLTHEGHGLIQPET